MASERDGLQEQKEILVKKLNHFRKKLAIISDAAQEFNLQMQIEETEKEIAEIEAKLHSDEPQQDLAPTQMPETKTYNQRPWLKILGTALITIITFLAALMGFVKDFRDFFFPPPNSVTIVTTQDTPNIQPNSITIDTPIIKKTNPTPLPPPKKETLIPKTISITLMVNAEFENAEITVNGNRVIPSAGSTPTFKKLNIEYNIAGYEVVLKTANKTCTKQFSIAENELNNLITIPVSCTN